MRILYLVLLFLFVLGVAGRQKCRPDKLYRKYRRSMRMLFRAVMHCPRGDSFMTRMLDEETDDEDIDRHYRRPRPPMGGPIGGFKPKSCEPTTNMINIMKRALSGVITRHKIGQIVRLSFHDCVGGCDGCINYNAKQNFGNWTDAVSELDCIFDSTYMSSVMSRSDFYQLAGIVAIENGARNANRDPPEIPFRYGREDCPTSPFAPDDVIRDFASGHNDAQELISYFDREFSFTKRDTVAIMGAHTVGLLTGREASEFLGIFKGSLSASFQWDENYYKLILNEDFDYTYTLNNMRGITNDDTRDRWQWDGSSPTLSPTPTLLNADVGFALDIQKDSNGRSSCDYSTCDFNQNTVDIVREFTDYDTWTEAFIPAYLIMTSFPKAFDELTEPTVSNPQDCWG